LPSDYVIGGDRRSAGAVNAHLVPIFFAHISNLLPDLLGAVLAFTLLYLPLPFCRNIIR
jgi:hypothetical protein